MMSVLDDLGRPLEALRISVGTPQETDIFLAALDEVYASF